MGMSYIHSGGASYPRFDEEMCKVAAVFGGIETARVKERREEVAGKLESWFGFMSGDDPSAEKLVFPVDTPEVLVRWFNHLYDMLFPDETKEVWENISRHPEIKKISPQLWHELETLAEYGECWDIC